MSLIRIESTDDYSPELSGGIFAYSFLLVALSCCAAEVAVDLLPPLLLPFLKPNDIDPFDVAVAVPRADCAGCRATTCFPPFFLLSDCPWKKVFEGIKFHESNHEALWDLSVIKIPVYLNYGWLMGVMHRLTLPSCNIFIIFFFFLSNV